MKTPCTILLIFCLALFSCKKESNSSIVGKWKLSERFDGYNNGGNFLWNTIPDSASILKEFKNDGSFSELLATGQPSACNGTYQLISEENIRITSNCYTSSYDVRFALDGGMVLFITRQVREGSVIEKYIVVP